MDDSILSSPIKANHKPGDMWPLIARAVARVMRRDGYSYGQIIKKTGIGRLILQKICAAPFLANLRERKTFKPCFFKKKNIKRIFTFARIKAKLYLIALTITIRPEMIFIKDRAKVYKRKARLWRLEKGMRGFDWLLSSFNFNLIEKLDTVLTLIDNMKKVLKKLYLTERLTCKVEDVIACKGIATVY
ncbi:hypothetical protein DL98DRAFT_520502 [Cadophora sp. DSE1049]|nr:hypothetical protein DL98DRAFT_520502 [Cadophora sp. DSE1049]